jgi:hypothetical protein
MQKRPCLIIYYPVLLRIKLKGKGSSNRKTNKIRWRKIDGDKCFIEGREEDGRKEIRERERERRRKEAVYSEKYTSFPTLSLSSSRKAFTSFAQKKKKTEIVSQFNTSFATKENFFFCEPTTELSFSPLAKILSLLINFYLLQRSEFVRSKFHRVNFPPTQFAICSLPNLPNFIFLCYCQKSDFFCPISLLNI